MLFLLSVVVKISDAALMGASDSLVRAIRTINRQRRRDGLQAIETDRCRDLTPEETMRFADMDLEDLMASLVSPLPVIRPPAVSSFLLFVSLL